MVEVSNYVGALEHGLARLQEGFPLSNRLLREVHAKLLARGRGAEKQPGSFRTSQNWIGGTRPGNAQFVPPPPPHVEPWMAALERFLHGATGHGALVKAALAHAYFETIYPFLDGNGRVGRLLIALMLHHDGVLRQPLLYLSLYFKQHRAEYYRLLDATRADGDWEAWLDFFFEGVLETARGAVDTAHRLLGLFRGDAERIRALRHATANALRVFDALRVQPVATINDVAGRARMAYLTAARAVEALQRLGIVRELTGRRRDPCSPMDAISTSSTKARSRCRREDDEHDATEQPMPQIFDNIELKLLEGLHAVLPRGHRECVLRRVSQPPWLGPGGRFGRRLALLALSHTDVNLSKGLPRQPSHSDAIDAILHVPMAPPWPMPRIRFLA